jgi:hypothetical protein
MLSDRDRASRKLGITGYAAQERLPGSIYPEMLRFATKRADALSQLEAGSPRDYAGSS